MDHTYSNSRYTLLLFLLFAAAIFVLGIVRVNPTEAIEKQRKIQEINQELLYLELDKQFLVRPEAEINSKIIEYQEALKLLD